MPPNQAKKSNSPDLPAYLYLSLAILWIYSGIVPVLFAQSQSLAMLAQLGVNPTLQIPLLLGSAVLDIIFGILILSCYRFDKWLWLAQLIVVVTYSLIVGIGLPENWTHPFAPLIKNIPIMALLLFMVQKHKNR